MQNFLYQITWYIY